MQAKAIDEGMEKLSGDPVDNGCLTGPCSWGIEDILVEELPACLGPYLAWQKKVNPPC